MITIDIQCQNCETRETVEVEGLVAIYLNKDRNIILFSHELTQAEILGLLVYSEDVIKGRMAEGKKGE